jgi:hypothetical protein
MLSGRYLAEIELTTQLNPCVLRVLYTIHSDSRVVRLVKRVRFMETAFFHQPTRSLGRLQHNDT